MRTQKKYAFSKKNATVDKTSVTILSPGMEFATLNKIKLPKFHQNKPQMIDQIITNEFLVFAHISLIRWEDTICRILLLLIFQA